MLSQYKCNIQNHIDEQIIGLCQSAQCTLQSRRVCQQCILQLKEDETFLVSDVKSEDDLNKIIQEYKSQLHQKLENVSKQSQIHRKLLLKELQEFLYYWQNEYYRWIYLESLSSQTKDQNETISLQQYLEHLNNDNLQGYLEKQSFKENNEIQQILQGKSNFFIQQKMNQQKVDFIENLHIQINNLNEQIDNNLKIHNQQKLLFMLNQRDNQHQLLNIYEKFEYAFLNQKEDFQQIIRQKQQLKFDDFISDYYLQDQLCRKGKLMADFGEVDESLNYFDQIIKLYPKNYQTYHRKAQTFVKQHNYQDALQCYDQFIKIDPTSYDALYDKADLLSKQSLFTEALLTYDRCIEIDPFNFRAYLSKAQIFQNQNKHLEALECYDQYIKINPTYYDAYYQKDHLLRQQNQLEESIQTQNQYLLIDPNHYYAHSDKGFIVMIIIAYLFNKLNMTQEAIECYDKCIKIDPKNYEAYQNKAQIYEKQNNYNEVLKTYDAFIRVVQNNYDPYYQKGYYKLLYLAQIFENQQQHQEAILCYQQFITIDPQNFDALMNLGQFY
ncbi:hypothetical protein pb186bvf_020679 [Paramecium bursaria]